MSRAGPLVPVLLVMLVGPSRDQCRAARQRKDTAHRFHVVAPVIFRDGRGHWPPTWSTCPSPPRLNAATPR